VKHLAFGNHFLNWLNIATCFQSNKWLPFDWLLISSWGWFPILLLSYFKLLNIHSLSIHTSWTHIDMGLGCKSLCHKVPLCNLQCFVGQWTFKFLGKHAHWWCSHNISKDASLSFARTCFAIKNHYGWGLIGVDPILLGSWSCGWL
jgi:hypothetical protein